MDEEIPLSECEVELEKGAVQPWTPETCERIEDILSEEGLHPAPETIIKIENLLDALAFRRAREVLRQMLAKIPKTSPAELALRRVLLGETEALRTEAARIGASHVAVLKVEKKIRRWMGLPKPALT